METCQLRHYVFFCVLVNQANAAQVCRDDQHAVELPDGSIACTDCIKCPPGSEVTIPCGTRRAIDTYVECKECASDYYSDSYSSESCKPCSTCNPDEVTIKRCTKISNTHCSCKPCPDGYYQNQTLSKCLPCSGCCLGDLDVVVPQCLMQGMPRTQSCSYHKRKPCLAKCWYDEITVVKHDGKQICLPCPVCSDEFGLTKPCGSVVTDGAIPKCELPILGETFVDQQGVLQSCKICSIGQKVLANCSTKSNTICGECMPGFYLNDHSKACEQCFWCCGFSDSQSIVNCIKEGMASSENSQGLAIKPHIPSLGFNEQFGQLQTVEQENYKVNSIELDKVTTLIVLSICFFLIWVAISVPLSEGNYQYPFPNEENNCELMEKKDCAEITETSSLAGSKEPELECPKQHSPGHMVFEKTGVEVVSLDNNRSTLQQLPRDLVLHATPEGLDLPGLLEDDEFPLSPAFIFISKNQLLEPLELQIPHGANMVLSPNKWKIILKELKNDEWVVSYVEGSKSCGIKEFLPKSNHVSFKTNYFATFAVVGHCEERSLPVFKRMKVMAFCNDTRVGEDLVVRLYCFDDCEWSFENVMREEKKEGGKPMSSVESLDFSVIHEEDVEIGVKDIDGWKLKSGHQMKISHASLKNSFSTTPRCNLVFSSASMEKKSSFFATIILTQASNQTLMYASTAIKEDPSWYTNQSSIANAMNGNQVTSIADITVVKSGKGKEKGISDCIIQLPALYST